MRQIKLSAGAIQFFMEVWRRAEKRRGGEWWLWYDDCGVLASRNTEPVKDPFAHSHKTRNHAQLNVNVIMIITSLTLAMKPLERKRDFLFTFQHAYTSLHHNDTCNDILIIFPFTRVLKRKTWAVKLVI